jgi:hypothetical protein
MGAFDEVMFAKGLLPSGTPRFAQEPGHCFQTKDFDHPFLDLYEVNHDGRLLCIREGGQMLEPPRDTEYHGDLEVYTGNTCAAASGVVYTKTGEDCEWVELSLRFTHGRLERITVVRQKRGPARPMSEFLRRVRNG